jgi:hypothetical protein
MLFAVTLLLAVALSAFGQEEETPTQFWMSYNHQQKIGELTRVFGTVGYEELVSKERIFGEWTRLYLNGGGSYDVGKRLRFAGGLGAYYTYHPEDVDDVFEFRLWQEGTAFWPESFGLVRRFVLTHRLRIEERFTELDGWNFAVRLRYRLDTKIPLNKYTLEPRSFYLPLAIEFYADLGDEAPEFFGNESKASVGLGYVINKTWTVDLRYHRQRSRVTIEDEFSTSSNVIDFTVNTSVRIRDLVKGR